jgi:catechol 2,3 dioxygenase
MTYDPGPQIAHAGGINLGTPNLEKSLWFFRDLLGMEVTAQSEGVAYLRGYQEKIHHSLTLTQQDEAAINSLSLRVARPQDVELFYKEMLADDIDAREIKSGTEIGRGEAVRFLLPGSEHPFELYYEIERPEAPEEIKSVLFGNSSRRRGLGVQRIDHLNLATTPETIGQAETWLRKSLGMKRREFVTGPDGNSLYVSWLSVNSKLHDVAIGANGAEPGRFHHVAFNMENFHDLLTAVDQLKDAGIQIDLGPGKHGIGQAMYLYVRDPGSGHRIELYSGGNTYFDPDHNPIKWELEDLKYGMTWYGDFPSYDASHPYQSTTATSGLEL